MVIDMGEKMFVLWDSETKEVGIGADPLVTVEVRQEKDIFTTVPDGYILYVASGEQKTVYGNLLVEGEVYVDMGGSLFVL